MFRSLRSDEYETKTDSAMILIDMAGHPRSTTVVVDSFCRTWVNNSFVNRKSVMRFESWLPAALPILLGLGACTAFAPSEEQVIYDMYESMCDNRSVEAMTPHLTEQSQKLLGFVKLALLANGTFNEADAIADACSKGSVVIHNKVKVNDARYLMEIIPPGSEEATKLAVVMEDGKWKVAIGGK